MSPTDAGAATAQTITIEYELPQPPEKVWRVLTEPALLAAWLLPNDIEAKVGHAFHFQPRAEPGGGDIACEILALEPHRLLRYSWRSGAPETDADDAALDTVVTFELAATAAGGTHLRLVHSGFPLRVQGRIGTVVGALAQPGNVRRLPRRAAGVPKAITGVKMQWAA
jgi:uncharacterized protein YndB with AHSA1/START domain